MRAIVAAASAACTQQQALSTGRHSGDPPNHSRSSSVRHASQSHYAVHQSKLPIALQPQLPLPAISFTAAPSHPAGVCGPCAMLLTRASARTGARLLAHSQRPLATPSSFTLRRAPAAAAGPIGVPKRPTSVIHQFTRGMAAPSTQAAAVEAAEAEQFTTAATNPLLAVRRGCRAVGQGGLRGSRHEVLRAQLQQQACA